jgi:hypothetical protein
MLFFSILNMEKRDKRNPTRTAENRSPSCKHYALSLSLLRFVMLLPSFPHSYPSMLLRKAKYTALLLFGKNAGRNMQLMTSKVKGTSHSQI